MSKFLNTRILVESDEQAIAVQELIFKEHGIEWMSGGKEIMKLWHPRSFFVSPQGRVTWGDQTAFADKDKRAVPVLTFAFEPVTTLVAKNPTIKERHKTMVRGKLYFTDELDAALAGVSAVTA